MQLTKGGGSDGNPPEGAADGRGLWRTSADVMECSALLQLKVIVYITLNGLFKPIFLEAIQINHEDLKTLFKHQGWPYMYTIFL